MSLPIQVLQLLRCPQCGAGLSESVSGLTCSATRTHRFRRKQDFLTFAEPPAGKYEPGYAARYAALWAYGYQTLHFGLNESLYRTVSSLVAESLASCRASRSQPLLVDCGCGVGRAAADASCLAPEGAVIGLDGSLAMLALARRVVCGRAGTEVDLAADGFGKLAIPGRGRDNVFLFRADVERLPVADDAADLALSVNIVDRLPDGPLAALAECHRILRPGGHLLFTDPLNFTVPSLWQRYGNGSALRKLLRDLGFRIEVWFDDLAYREILDARGSFEEFKTLVILARKWGGPRAPRRAAHSVRGFRE